jgi:predicted phage terminase large subunit-like protein
MSDVKGYVRATFNPDASSWVKKFFAPWVDDQYLDPAIGGEIRYFIRVSGIVTWFRDKATALEQLRMSDPSADDEDVKSATFIPSTVYDNPKMLEKNPGYIGWLKSLPPVERARLLMGDWNVLPAAGKVYDRTWFEIVSRIPSGTPTVQTGWGDIISHGVHQSEVRFWDFAGTEKKLKGPQPDFTAGVKLRLVGDTYYVVDVIQVQLNPAGVDQLIVDTARLDGPECMVRWEEEGGASGKRDTYHIATMLNGYDANGVRPLGDKITRSRGVVSQARAGNVKILRAPWNDAFLNELHHLPDWKNDDQADALSGAYLVLTEESGSIGRSENPTDY